MLLYDNRSAGILKRRIEDTYPPEDYVAQVYEDACCFLQMAVGDGYGVTREFSLEEFCRNFHHFPVRAYNALQLLSRSGFIEWADAEENRSRVMMSCQRDDLYNYRIPPAAERVLRHLLRTCTGIFSEFAFIEEGEIAIALGMTEAEVSEALISLSRMHILQFVPRKYIPYLTFVQRRVDRDEVILPHAVYDDRKRELAQRVQTMIGYLDTDECRSRYLLNYFGEKEAGECGRCDNCVLGEQTAEALGEPLAPYHLRISKEQMEEARQSIVSQLKERSPLSLRDIHIPDMPDRIVSAVLHRMFEEEQLVMQPDGLTVVLKEG